jgi:prevent-host-death family protein
VGHEITQRELRNDSGRVMRALDAGESFTVTRHGVPVGELLPAADRRFVARGAVLRAFSGAPALDAERFRSDVDSRIDLDPGPRG